MMKALVVALACAPVVAAADDHVTLEADTLGSVWGFASGGSLGYEHRFDPMSGATVRARASRGDAFNENPAKFMLFGALAGYRIHTTNSDDLVSAFASVELGWIGARTERYMGDFDEQVPVAWVSKVDAELSVGVEVMQHVTAEVRVQVPVFGFGAAVGVTF